MSDLIYRQAAIDALLHNQEVYSNNFGTDAIDKYTTAIIANDVETIVQLPSAQPERKTGRWMFIERREPQFDLYGVKTWAVAYRCSECGLIHAVIEDFGHYAFCPRCGSKMEDTDGN